MAKLKRKPTDRSLLRKLELAATALIMSARINIRTDRPWPTKSTVPGKNVVRVADVLNEITNYRVDKKP